MEITLEKIELITEKTGVTYAEAKNALEEADGSVVDAIMLLEETSCPPQEKYSVQDIGSNVLEEIKSIARKGNATRILVTKKGRVMLNVPVNAGAVSAVLAPLPTAFAFLAMFGTKCNVQIVFKGGRVVNIAGNAKKKK